MPEAVTVPPLGTDLAIATGVLGVSVGVGVVARKQAVMATAEAASTVTRRYVRNIIIRRPVRLAA
jgi:hypothetical protein